MSNRTLIFAVLLALALGVVALLVLKNKPAGPGGAAGTLPAGSKIIELDAARVRGLVVESAGSPALPGAVTRIDRDSGTAAPAAEWRMSFGSPGVAGAPTPTAAPRASWRVEPGRVRDALRLLSDVRTTGVPAPDATLGDAPTIVRLVLSGGAAPATAAGTSPEITLKFSARQLGGQGFIEVTCPPDCLPREPGASPESGTPPAAVTRRAMVPASLHSLFMTDAIRSWRDPLIMPGVLAEASRLRLITAQGSSLALGKVAGRWGISEPLAAPADPAAVQKLLLAVESLRITRFFDERAPDAASTGLDAPVARIIVESDGPAGSAPVRRELAVGAPIDAAGKNRYASVDGGETLVGIDAAPLGSQMDTDPTVYMSRAATAAAAPDIGLLMFVAEKPVAPVAAAGALPVPSAPPVPNMGFLRTLTGWVELRPDGSQVAQDPKRAEAIADFIKFLTSESASSVTLSAPTGYQPIGKLALRTAGDQPLDDLIIARFAATGVTVTTGKVHRIYGTVPELLRAALGPIEPNAGVGPDGKEIKDITK